MSFHTHTMFPGDIYESAKRFADDVVKSCSGKDDTLPIMQTAWTTANELGWTTFLVPEDKGGAGASFQDLAGVVEGIGHSGCSLPVTKICHDVPVILLASNTGSALQLLEQITQSGTTITCATTGTDQLNVAKTNNGYLLNGEVISIETGSTPSVVLLRCQSTAGQALVLALKIEQSGVTTRFYKRMDGQVLLDLTLRNVSLSADQVLLHDADALNIQSRIESFGILFTAIECVSAMGRLIHETIEYLKNRQQFGQTLAKFQVLRHAVADMYVDYENLRAQTQALIDETNGESVDARRCSLLMLSVAGIGRRVAEKAIQTHGGMGMTEELLAARLAKRLLFAGFEHGGEQRHLTLAGNLTFQQRQTA